MAKRRTYHDVIGADPDPKTVRRLADNATKELLEAGIREATEELKKPMGDTMRAMLVMERKEMRAALALIKEAE